MNVRRVASLLRKISVLGIELADALEQVEPTKVKRRPTGPAPEPASPEAIIKVQRRLRRIGIAS